jgi:hypothetical protein
LLGLVAEKALLSEPIKNMFFEVLLEQMIAAIKQIEEVICCV